MSIFGGFEAVKRPMKISALRKQAARYTGEQLRYDIYGQDSVGGYYQEKVCNIKNTQIEKWG